MNLLLKILLKIVETETVLVSKNSWLHVKRVVVTTKQFVNITNKRQFTVIETQISKIFGYTVFLRKSRVICVFFELKIFPIFYLFLK